MDYLPVVCFELPFIIVIIFFLSTPGTHFQFHSLLHIVDSGV